jgi:integrase
VDPSVHRKLIQDAKAETFEALAREWLAMRAKTTAAVTQQKALWLLEMISPHIGKRPIRDVTSPELLSALRKIEPRGYHETAHRAKQNCGQILCRP